MARWPRHRKLTLTISHRGGAESWWLVEARGSHGVFPGHLAIEDVMVQVLNEGSWDGREAAAGDAGAWERSTPVVNQD